MWLSGLCLAWSSKTLGSFPSTEKNKTNHNLKKRSQQWPLASEGPLEYWGCPLSLRCPEPIGAKGAPTSAAPSICHTWTPRHLPGPNSAQAPTPRPFEGRGGPQEPVLRPAGSAGRRRGARRTGRPPWGGSPGSQAWRGLQTQTPGAGRQRSAPDCPFPFFSQARTLKPYLGPVPTKHGGGAT